MNSRPLPKLAFALIAVLALPLSARGESPRIAPTQAVVAANGMVVAQEAIAARVGAEILQNGGNAIDAAVATGFAMAVTYPRAGNIGGGGFMVIRLPIARTPPSTIARPRRRQSTPNPPSTRRAMPIRRNRATPRSPSACPARSRAWHSRRRNTAPANSRWPI